MLREEGVRELDLRFQPGGLVEASGTIDRLFTVPFGIRGKLDLTRDGKIRFSPDQVRVLGLPVPRIAVAIVNAIVGDDLAKLDIQSDGDSLIVDPKSFLPPNVQLKLTRLTTDGDSLVLEGGPPPPAPPPRILTA